MKKKRKERSSLKRVIPFNFFCFYFFVLFWIMCLLQKQRLEHPTGNRRDGLRHERQVRRYPSGKINESYTKNNVNIKRKLRHYYFKWVFVSFNFTNYVKLSEVVSQVWTYRWNESILHYCIPNQIEATFSTNLQKHTTIIFFTTY